MCASLVIGVSGQDGVYMADLLSQSGAHVVGVARSRVDLFEKVPERVLSRIQTESWDMRDTDVFESILRTHRVKEIYNFAAYASGAGMYDYPVAIGDINGLAVARILESIRRVDKNIRFCQASSSEVFGEVFESPQSEKTLRNPRSPYGSAKLYADSISNVYRSHFGLFTCSAILYNHESPRRGTGFVTRKITQQVAEIKLGLRQELYLGNLDARRDWGYAGDYVRAMHLMLQHAVPGDYVVATGLLHTVRDFCECAFSHLGLDYHDHVRVDPSFYRPEEPMLLVGDSAKARRVLGWAPTVDFEWLVKMMVDADMSMLQSGKEKKASHV